MIEATNRTKTLGFAAAVALTLGLGAAACGDDGGGSAGSFCDKAKTADKAFGSDFDPTDKDLMSKVISTMEDMVDVAPSAIRDDLATMLDGMQALKDVDLTDPEAAQEALAGLDQDKIEAASDKVEKYLEDDCGIKPD